MSGLAEGGILSITTPITTIIVWIQIVMFIIFSRILVIDVSVFIFIEDKIFIFFNKLQNVIQNEWCSVRIPTAMRSNMTAIIAKYTTFICKTLPFFSTIS